MQDNKKTIEPPVYIPVHLKTTKTIAEIFCVSIHRIAKWKKLGAPIKVIGKSNQARYDELWEWLKHNM